MMRWFVTRARILQFLLLIIPGVNEIFEILIRLDQAIKKPSFKSIVVFILTFPLGWLLGFIDAINTMVNHSLVLL